MKKIVLVGLLIYLCVALSACTATDPDNLFEITPVDTTANTSGSSTEDTQSESKEEEILYTWSYQYGNMQKALPPGNFMLLENEVLVSHDFGNGTRVYSYHLVSGEIKPYCKDATCTHKSCAASSLWTNLEVYDGSIFGMNRSRQLIEVNGETIDIIIPSEITNFFHHDNKLYIRTADSSLMVLEEGQKEPSVVIEEYTGYWHLIFGDYLYANTNDGNIIRVHIAAEDPAEEMIVQNGEGITDGQHIYYVDSKTNHLYRCEMDGSDAQLLVEQPVLLASINFDDEYFYYRLLKDMETSEDSTADVSQQTLDDLFCGYSDSYDIYRFPKEDPTQIKKIVTLQESAYQVFTVPGTGKIFVTTYAPQGEERPLYVVGTDGSNPTKLEIPEY